MLHIFTKTDLNTLILTLLNQIKSQSDYLQNMAHVVLCNCPSLSVGTEMLACLNKLRGMQMETVA